MLCWEAAMRASRGKGHLQEDLATFLREEGGGREALAGGEAGAEGRQDRSGSERGQPRSISQAALWDEAGRSSVLRWPHLLKLSLQQLGWTQKREGQRHHLC